MNRAKIAGSISLGEVAARAEWLVVGCGKCDRTGRVRLSGLLERYGHDYPMTQLRCDLAGDCPRLQAGTQLSDLCDAHFPELPRIMGVKQGEAP